MLTSTHSDGWQVLLACLHQVPTAAARLFHAARRRLIALLRRRGCHDPEWVADEAFQRTATRLAAKAELLQGDAIAYVTAVARRIALEEGRRSARMFALTCEPVAETEPAVERVRREALEACLAALPEDDRALLLAYHAGRGVERIARRAQLAVQRGVERGALRVRAHRLRSRFAVMVRAELARRLALVPSIALR
jgi:DNA-directed RNA polymerase specialized sigma24 family protein